eukprot:CAMPEP_0184645616 /NCGR_PEP_ID=MMETSP0308-20130426/2128_1 /TAXON_ID=38269 /ORGANISM="Gloeochaete witrockiana, Strain SAG 46.84" /LENGTH=100 /DNA_ID=CAMNT_0027074805 /DNA_START=301 /DNA_END=603 /DNA_ORIENTATION=-
MAQLQETSPHIKFQQFHNFLADHIREEPNSFMILLLKEDQEMGLRVLTVWDDISKNIRFDRLPHLIKDELYEIKMATLREHLQETFEAENVGDEIPNAEI